MEAKEIKRAIKKHGEGKNVSYDDKYFTHNMPEFMCIAEISFKVGKESALTEEGVEASIGNIIKRERLAGRREVVEWADQDCDCGMNLLVTHWQCPTCRQTKFKEWGVHNG